MTQTYTESLDEWFKRETWNKKQAACLLLGTNPKEGSTFQEWYDSSPFCYDWGIERWAENISHLEYILYKEARRKGDKLDSIMLRPKSVAQWAYDNDRKYWLDERFYAYIIENKDSLELDDCAWIDRDYAKWLRKRHWTFIESINLLAGYPAKEINKDIVAENNLNYEIYDALRVAVLADEVPCKNKEDDKLWLLDGVATLQWAISRKFPLPPMLLAASKEVYPEIFGTPDESKPQPALRQNQIDKQICQAVARTLWHINPECTIEEIKAHHAIQEIAGGKNYPGKNTLRDWLGEVDPRPREAKRGRKKKLPSNAG